MRAVALVFAALALVCVSSSGGAFLSLILLAASDCLKAHLLHSLMALEHPLRSDSRTRAFHFCGQATP